jgi:uncharacterized protein YaaW (UPF0174 family)
MTIFESLSKFAKERKLAYKKKLFKLVALIFIVTIVAVAGAIALSEILYFLLLVFLVLSGCLFAYLKIRGTELTTFLAQIRAAIEKVLSLLRDKQEEFRDLNKDPSEFSLTELLVHANDEELDALQKFSKIKLENLEQFELAIRKKASNDVARLIEKVKGTGEDLAVATYSDMLDLTGSRLKIERDNREDLEFEKHIVQVAFEKMVDTMDEKDRKLLEHEISKYAEKHLGKKNLDIALSSGGLIAANLGGFATYTMASTLLSGVGSSIGVTLPFAAYTTLSSTLSMIMGPLGISALGLWGLYKITSPNTKVTILVVLSLAAIRERLIFEYPNKREEMQKEINDLLRQKETLKELFEKAELLSQPGKIYQLFDNTTKQKRIEEKK